MGNTIGSSPRPAATVPTSTASAATSAPAAASTQAPAAPDTFGSQVPSKIPLGETIHPTQTPEQISAMSNDELKAFKGEEIMGMNKNQFEKFEEAVAKDGGPGMMNLDPQARKAMLRKNIMKAIMEDCQRIAQKHEKW